MLRLGGFRLVLRHSCKLGCFNVGKSSLDFVSIDFGMCWQSRCPMNIVELEYDVWIRVRGLLEKLVVIGGFWLLWKPLGGPFTIRAQKGWEALGCIL